jgi:drug/metabolite transporter (DMT)-like permease
MMGRSFLPAGIRSALAAVTAAQIALVLGILIANQFFNVGSTACFAASAHADRIKVFVFWQIVGGLFGLGVQLSYAGLVRYWSLPAANVLGIGLAFVSVQAFTAYLIFHESFNRSQWVGTAFVFAGIVLVAMPRH